MAAAFPGPVFGMTISWDFFYIAMSIVEPFSRRQNFSTRRKNLTNIWSGWRKPALTPGSQLESFEILITKILMREKFGYSIKRQSMLTRSLLLWDLLPGEFRYWNMKQKPLWTDIKTRSKNFTFRRKKPRICSWRPLKKLGAE